MRSLLTWIAWVLLAFAATLPGAVSPPGEWYAALSKPDWTPAGWVFPVVWATLYVCMGTAAWLVQRAGSAQHPARGPLALFFVQLALNAAWTPIFFGLHAIFPALVVIVVLWVAILATLLAFRRVSTPAAWLFAPYLAWVSVALVLNFQIWRLNE
ncbi:MAG: TspO/MBR family protein [Planctomycetota bacterium]